MKGCGVKDTLPQLNRLQLLRVQHLLITQYNTVALSSSAYPVLNTLVVPNIYCNKQNKIIKKHQRSNIQSFHQHYWHKSKAGEKTEHTFLNLKFPRDCKEKCKLTIY